MVLKGLPEEYKPFVVVVTQSDKEQKFSEFKVALRSFEDTERTSVTPGSHSVMKTEYKKESQSEIVCYQCGHPGHIARFCKSNNKNRRRQWCNTCHNSSHTDRACRRKGKSKTDKVKQASETLEDSDNEAEHLFAFEVNSCAGESVTKKPNALQVDCGATTHIINDESKFSNFDDKFAPEKHYIELADGTRSNNVALKRGDVEITIMDTTVTGKRVNATLKNALYIPTYPQIYSQCKLRLKDVLQESSLTVDVKAEHPKKRRPLAGHLFVWQTRNRPLFPSSSEKIRLRNSLLGERKVPIPTTAPKERVRDVLFEVFPPLKTCGGFELLLSDEKSRRNLCVVKYGSCCADEIRCWGTGRIYIRPIQTDIALGDDGGSDEECEKCLLCKVSIPLRQMRDHMELCPAGSPLTDYEGNQTSSNGENDVDRGNQEGPDHDNEVELVRELSPIATTQEAESQGDAAITQEEIRNTYLMWGKDNSFKIDPKSTHDNDETNFLAKCHYNAFRGKTSYESHLRNALEKTFQAMRTCDDPVTILKEFSRNLHRGRLLDLVSDSDLCEGETSDIFVSRFDLFETGMEEILREGLSDFSLPLEVTFAGENAQDYGGPRREFLGCMLREIRDRLFKEQGAAGHILQEDEASLEKNNYFGAGLFFGFSLLQGGPPPNFLSEEQIQRIFTRDNVDALGRAEIQFRNGLKQFGVIELLHKKPSLIFLFRKTAVLPMTYPKLVKLLEAVFSEMGTNRRQQEERTYRLFLNYLKEVSAARRANGKISLEDVLKFVTGCNYEPVLGFQMKPSICFDTTMPSCIPISNTCINRLTLPIGEKVPESKEELFFFSLITRF
ncbi:uncharacterized protein [Montipora capricornis]|uniref:uncharacterized protein n=1 Tax=Montipora capricornis TaxID=246305 RepID=UPI0035F14AB4